MKYILYIISKGLFNNYVKLLVCKPRWLISPVHYVITE